MGYLIGNILKHRLINSPFDTIELLEGDTSKNYFQD